MFLQEKMVGEPQSIPQSIIYKLVDETINKDATDLKFPDTGKKWDIFVYIIQIPLTHLQYISIPDPLSKRNENFYPLSLIMSILWIFLYSYIIVWFTYDTSRVINIPYSIIPMFIYPLGISLRDNKKFRDFEICLNMFKQELPDQEITLAETYSPQIFQMTGLSGFAWLLFVIINQEPVKFLNESIRYQLPILIGVVIIKYSILLYNTF